MITPAVEEYLEAIYKMSLEDEGTVIAARLAERMKVSPPTAADMLRRLTDGGFITVGKPEGITLTKKGREEAERLVRRHRLAERLLTDVLGLKWEDVHEEACRLEHVISDQIEAKLIEKLGDPETCPHGHPIPGHKRSRKRSGQPPRPLSSLSVGETAVIDKVAEEEPGLLQYLATLGLLPRAVISIREIAPFRGPMLVEVAGAQYALGQEVAAKIMVREK